MIIPRVQNCLKCGILHLKQHVRSATRLDSDHLLDVFITDPILWMHDVNDCRHGDGNWSPAYPSKCFHQSCEHSSFSSIYILAYQRHWSCWVATFVDHPSTPHLQRLQNSLPFSWKTSHKDSTSTEGYHRVAVSHGNGRLRQETLAGRKTTYAFIWNCSLLWLG